MFCMNCGQQIEDGASFCPYCGTAQSVQQKDDQQPGGQSNQQYQQVGQQYQQYQNPQYQNPQYQNPQYQNPQTDGINDTGSFWWAIPGILLPLAGIIIFFVVRKNKPKTAKTAIIGAGVGVLVYLLFYH